MKQIILMSFNDVTDGVAHMSSSNYPCAFTVNKNWDNWYDATGSILQGIPEQTGSNLMLPDIKYNIHCISDSANWVDNEYCYDGTFIFITRP